jgi:hypothetical protein
VAASCRDESRDEGCGVEFPPAAAAGASKWVDGLLRFGLVRIVEREPELLELRLVDLEDLVESLLAVVLLGRVAADEF